MPTAVVLSLRANEHVFLPANLGRALHAWFLSRVSAVDRDLADQIHVPNTARPFTVSNLWAAHRRNHRQVEIDPGKLCYFRITGLTEELSTFLDSEAFAVQGEKIELQNTLFSIVDIARHPADHPCADQNGYSEMIERYSQVGEELNTPLRLRFTSPTVFRSRGANLPMPLPELVFGSLARRWDSFASTALPKELPTFVTEQVVISSYRLRTERVEFGRSGSLGIISGFIGWCDYACLTPEHPWSSLLHMLVDYAFYSGVGLRTTVGLGQCCIVRRV